MRNKTAQVWMIIAVVVGCVIVFGSLASKISAARRSLSIAEANVAAANDTLRTYESEKDTLTNTVARFAYQDSVNTDSIVKLGGSLGTALRTTRSTLRSLTQARASFDSLTQQLEAQSDTTVQKDDSTEVRIASTTVDGPPIEGTIEVEIPQRPNPVLFRPALTVTPFDIVYGISCDEEQNAQTNIEKPDWVNISMTPGVVSPDVCHPYQPISLGSFKVTMGGVAVGAGVGALVAFTISAILGS